MHLTFSWLQLPRAILSLSPLTPRALYIYNNRVYMVATKEGELRHQLSNNPGCNALCGQIRRHWPSMGRLHLVLHRECNLPSIEFPLYLWVMHLYLFKLISIIPVPLSYKSPLVYLMVIGSREGWWCQWGFWSLETDNSGDEDNNEGSDSGENDEGI